MPVAKIGKSERLGGLNVIVGEVLNRVHAAVAHIADTDKRGRRLQENKLPQILQLRAEADVGSIVYQNEEFETGMLATQRNPICYLSSSATEIHLHVLAFEVGLLAAVTSFRGNHHVNGNHSGGGRLLRINGTRTKCK
jgi:hypothetical protein